ncbi:MAG: hypothetical protein CME70_19110 [Halobacteriovorax sp.]|nr:hypothetical protein [Halobacteriovorax sp.]|tara:strand:- start:67983 stop:68447 length:465 start_codon:yes stop_codon:yes gene_type:complete
MIPDYFSHSANEDWDENERHRPYWKQVFAHFSALEGMELEYFGADDAAHEFKLDDIIFKVLEDPDDGYRSHLGVIEYGSQSNSIFFRTSLGKVRIEVYDGEKRGDSWGSEACQGYRLVDVNDGHIWLEFGTDNMDDYYPYFVFRHMPKDVQGTS